MSDEWVPAAVTCKNAIPFEELPAEVRKHVEHARGWAMNDGGWEGVTFVDEPHGNLFSVRRSTDELGTEEIEVVEIR